MSAPTLTGGQLLTLGAVIFAGFALYEAVLKKPGGTASTQPGQAQRDAGLMQWHDITQAQAAEIAGNLESTAPHF